MDLKGVTEQELVIRLQQGDIKAFEEIYERYWWTMYVIAHRKTKSKEVSEEMVQDLFASIWKKREQFEIHLSLAGYLKSSIHYIIINYFHALLVRNKHSHYLRQTSVNESSVTEETINLWELRHEMEKGIALLPDKSRQIFELSRLENQSNHDIARQLNLSEKAVEYHISKALKLLRLYLKDFLLIGFLMLDCLNS